MSAMEPELDPDELYRQHIIKKVKDGLCLAVSNDQVRITVDNINHLLSILNINTYDEDVLDLIRNALIDTGGDIETDDFEKVVLKSVLTKDEEVEKAIEDAYRIVDVDGDGVITAADIYQLMLAIGEMISDDELLHA
ncbi:calmodulin-like [Haliotis rubra]|uniref:calmodulin-like n=1 Tax=Haliotis rubra TaxID=36100 RepID=UPI001EE54369|nr:calmodulin-like [Haliotis rubra]